MTCTWWSPVDQHNTNCLSTERHTLGKLTKYLASDRTCLTTAHCIVGSCRLLIRTTRSHKYGFTILLTRGQALCDEGRSVLLALRGRWAFKHGPTNLRQVRTTLLNTLALSRWYMLVVTVTESEESLCNIFPMAECSASESCFRALKEWV